MIIFKLHTTTTQILKLDILSLDTMDVWNPLIDTIPTMVKSTHGTIEKPRNDFLDMMSEQLACGHQCLP